MKALQRLAAIDKVRGALHCIFSKTKTNVEAKVTSNYLINLERAEGLCAQKVESLNVKNKGDCTHHTRRTLTSKFLHKLDPKRLSKSENGRVNLSFPRIR